jgi:hypothetical protein
MTKAMRWGVSALLILGGVAVGSFTGCSSDDDTGTPTPEDTGSGEDTSVDTGTPDTGMAEETATDTGTATEAGETMPPKADRAATLLMAAPDLAPQYVCLAAFISTPEEVATKDPADALLIGIPDPTAKDDESKYSPIPYGAVLPLPLNAKALAALKSLTVVVYVTTTKPMSSADCKTGWAAAKTDTKKWKAFAKNAIDAGDNALLAVTGCAGAGGTATTTECGAGNNLEITLKKVDTTVPTTFSGESTGPKVGIDFVNLSRYAGAGTSGPPSWQGIDAYLVFSKATPVTLDAGVDETGDATTADGGTTVAPDVAKAVKVADNKSYGDVVSVVGVQAGDFADAGTYLVVVPHGASLATSPPCSSAPGPTCAAYIPFKPFIDALKPAGAGFKDGHNQFVALAGGPIPKALTDAGAPDPASAPVRILMGSADKP